MTSVVYQEHEDGRRCLFAKDHATGSREVCAGVSAIFYALANWVNAGRGGPHVDKVYAIQLTPGAALVEAAGDECLIQVFEAAVLGLMAVSQTYGEQYLQVKVYEIEG